MSSADHVRRNRELWERDADEYQADHESSLPVDQMVWGVWRIPEDELEVLGDVAGLDVLELGCGGGQWSARLAAAGARPVAIDISVAQLRHAQRIRADVGGTYALCAADGEVLPFRDASFDLVMTDWGAPSFTDPHRTIPEAARVLRPGGALAFSTSHPLEFLSYDTHRGERTERFQRPYLGMRQLTNADGMVEFNLSFGDWFKLFTSAGFVVERLVEPAPPVGASTTYVAYDDVDWGRRFPYEIIWRLRKLDVRAVS